MHAYKISEFHAVIREENLCNLLGGRAMRAASFKPLAPSH